MGFRKRKKNNLLFTIHHPSSPSLCQTPLLPPPPFIDATDLPLQENRDSDSQFEALSREPPPLWSIPTVIAAFIQLPMLVVNFGGFVCIAAAVLVCTAAARLGMSVGSNCSLFPIRVRFHYITHVSIHVSFKL
ncbi:unnamed protein product [Trifolium pratense]|uniref:Uncharacterized protein n=1 Tax=Trifolium pratense TaxID=57577 RepID=A0ACB0I6I4_TRIPR|nr:unnamed protein product [Trifolium pratense]